MGQVSPCESSKITRVWATETIGCFKLTLKTMMELDGSGAVQTDTGKSNIWNKGPQHLVCNTFGTGMMWMLLFEVAKWCLYRNWTALGPHQAQ